MTQTIRVLIADDHAMMRSVLRMMLADAPDIELLGEATTGDEARQLCLALEPDVLLLDVSMPGPPPLKTVAFLHEQCPATKILIVSASDPAVFARPLVKAGATGYILKDRIREILLPAIRGVMKPTP